MQRIVCGWVEASIVSPECPSFAFRGAVARPWERRRDRTRGAAGRVRAGSYLSTVLDLDPYSWGFAALQFWRKIVLRSGAQSSSPFAYESHDWWLPPRGATDRVTDFSEVSMRRPKLSVYRAFRAATYAAPLPPLEPYRRCTCGGCRECRENAKWDRIFAKFETKEREVRGIFQCALVDF